MDKLEFKSLVTAQEAVRVSKYRGLKDIYIANEIAEEYKTSGDVMELIFLFGTIWNAGRIQGIREERAKRSQYRKE
jgi:hypothetical protein